MPENDKAEQVQTVPPHIGFPHELEQLGDRQLAIEARLKAG